MREFNPSQAMRIWLLALVAVASPVGVIRAFEPPVKSAEVIGTEFGLSHSGVWSWRSQQGSESIEADLHWQSLGFSDYDMRQTRGSLIGRTCIVARIEIVRAGLANVSNKQRSDSVVFGARIGDVVYLTDVESLLPIRNNEDLMPEGIIAAMKHWNEAHPNGIADALELNLSGPDHVEVKLRLRHDIPLLQTEITALEAIAVPIETPEAIGALWSGELCPKDLATSAEKPCMLTRIQISEQDEVVIGFFSNRNEIKRLEGSVPAGSPWKSREQFIQCMQELNEAGISDFNGEIPSKFGEIVEKRLGQSRRPDQMIQDAIDIFGSWDAMVSATCDLPEIVHLPFVGFKKDGVFRLLGYRRREVEEGVEDGPQFWTYMLELREKNDNLEGVYRTFYLPQTDAPFPLEFRQSFPITFQRSAEVPASQPEVLVAPRLQHP